MQKFIQWLWHKKVRTARDFKASSEWKWQHDDNADKFHIKIDDNEYDEHAHVESNLRRKVCKHNYKKQQLGLNCYGTLGVFKNGYLRIIENDKEFIGNEIIEEEVKILSEDAMQAIKNKEANAATDALEKYDHAAGLCMIEDDHKIER